MVQEASVTSASPIRSRQTLNISLWVLQALLAVFFVVASAVPKLIGEATAVEIFDDIGIGQWFRYVVAALEIAGGIGLVVPRLTRLAALGLGLLMISAFITQAFIIGGGLLAITPLVLLALLGVIAWGRSRT